MTNKALMERPDLKVHYYAGGNKFPAMVLAGNLSDSVNWDGDSRELANGLPLTKFFMVMFALITVMTLSMTPMNNPSLMHLNSHGLSATTRTIG